jgi:hypothetical protein
MNEELRDHLERQVAANIATGMSPAEARRQAVLQLGTLEEVKDGCREQRGGFWLETLAADLRYGIRAALRIISRAGNLFLRGRQPQGYLRGFLRADHQTFIPIRKDAT